MYVHLLQCSSCIEWTDPIPTPLFVQRSDAQCCEISNIFREFFRQGQNQGGSDWNLMYMGQKQLELQRK